MDAAELLLGDAPFIADTSAWWRFSSLPAELAGLIKEAVADERLWTTPIVRMEILYSARSTSEYIELETELDALRILRNDRAVTDAAMSAICELAERSDGYHRVPLTDVGAVVLAFVIPVWARGQQPMWPVALVAIAVVTAAGVLLARQPGLHDWLRRR